jgi:hypothetical protein
VCTTKERPAIIQYEHGPEQRKCGIGRCGRGERAEFTAGAVVFKELEVVVLFVEQQ